ncbi:TetR/AcrR family transcriptional regulator [Kutzneria sp. CA-103260]|uniref:TetR/AcrR family transcriptional regulator n=1 Tax=Kutzneria sp. CA-103260 TaxID=2802641 RepID=UPI001BA7AE25|nr:TetR/AcrR family transcriptional regulator [Kutzneria sp. CA-103260]
MTTEPQARRTSGGPVLRDDVTEAIRVAFFEEMAEVGYGRLSLDAVAKRANAGKAAIYRRWPGGKDAMTVALLKDFAAEVLQVPDTGTLRGDVRQFLVNACATLEDPLTRNMLPDLMAEAGRNPALGDAFVGAFAMPRRDKAEQILHRAVERGDIPADTGLDVALELMTGPVYWHTVVIRSSTDDAYFDQLTNTILKALS